MIYFIDDDDAQTYPYRFFINRVYGYEVKYINTAIVALTAIKNEDPKKIEQIIIDVMLVPGDPVLDVNNLFSQEKTNNFLQTGLTLLNALLEINASFNSKIVLLSRATDPNLVEAITSVEKQYNLPYIKKNRNLIPIEFAKTINNRIVNRGLIKDEI